MRKIKATIKNYNLSPYFSYEITWNIGKCKYSSVFATKAAAAYSLESMYGERVKIIDKTN